MLDPICANITTGLFSVDPAAIDKNYSVATAEGKRHYSGITCSWHGYLNKPWCSKCGGQLQPMVESIFWQSVIAADAALHRNGVWVDVCRWTTEKCFPNFETMVQVYNSVKGTKYKPQDFVPF